ARAPPTTGAILPATLKPAASLSCPIVSALERWVTHGVQPAALHWFGSQVVEIKQISAYSCRQMNGKGGRGISEHAFGNALDIAGFTLADGRKISVQKGWKGSPEEQGFLHDVQLYACQTFVTVLAPGYNAAHYNHFHVDLQRRKNGRRPCRPRAIKGEVVAARARAVYASKHGGANYTGSIATADARDSAPEAVPGADGLVEDDSDDGVTGSIAKPASNPAQEVVEAVPGADGLADDGEDVTGSIGGSSAGWPRLAPISATAIH
ncbi:MAG: extensin family protein, partial [Pseudolabrys sp.]|nr:extensin family protein [Pseudolabrys sp.]